MDPAVTAAVIAVPVGLVSAAAAYAGARSQARSAHRGAVDAVRRQHQRDAYAAFLTACNAYVAATAWTTCFEQTWTEVSPGPTSHPSDEQLAALTSTRIAAVSVDEMTRTGAVVDLEGPDHISAAARITLGTARMVRRQAQAVPRTPDAVNELVGTHSQLVTATEGFVEAARAHLNSGYE
ncbi:hypothetical protein ACWEQW_05730 [Streptomyces nigra]